MNASTSARLAIAEALQAAGLPAYPAGMGTTPLPSIVVQPDSPYLEPTTVGKGTWRVNLRLVISVQAFDTMTSLAAIEDLAESAAIALPAGCQVQSLTMPSQQSLGEAQGSIYAAELVLSAVATKE
mgnify:CR=1 FL=1